MEERDLKEFAETGLIWFVNMILHIFGWVIAIEYDEGEAVRMYPARTQWRGFKEEDNTKGYINVSKWMAENASELYEESKK